MLASMRSIDTAGRMACNLLLRVVRCGTCGFSLADHESGLVLGANPRS